MKTARDLGASLDVHDDLLARRGVEVWVGAEPTFTRAGSADPAVTTEAERDDKLALELADRLPGTTVSRIVGRQVPDEPQDPSVVAVDLMPQPSARAFATHLRDVYAAAATAGLAASRYRFNGDLADSGGGGQISLGGSRPATSPFVRYPHVLPALLRYLNNHPALSFWFANECVGSASQGPRPDEGVRERWEELDLTLGWLEGWRIAASSHPHSCGTRSRRCS